MFITNIDTIVDGTPYTTLYELIQQYLRAPRLELLEQLLQGEYEALRDCKRQGIDVFMSPDKRKFVFKGLNEIAITTEITVNRDRDIMSIHLSIPFSMKEFAENILRSIPQDSMKYFHFMEIDYHWERRSYILSNSWLAQEPF